MIIKANENTEVYNQDGAVGKLIGQENDCEYVKLSLTQGSKIEKHALPFPVTFFVIKGDGVAYVQGETLSASSGDMLEVKAGLERGWENKNTIELEILVIKHLS